MKKASSILSYVFAKILPINAALRRPSDHYLYQTYILQRIDVI